MELESSNVSSTTVLFQTKRKVEQLAQNASGSCIALASSSIGGNIWDGEVSVLFADKEGRCTLSHRNSLTGVAWVDSDTLCVSSDGGDVTVYARSNANLSAAASGFQAAFQVVGSLEYHDDVVSCIAFAPLGRLVATSWDGSMSIWNPREPRLPITAVPGHHAAPIHALAVHPASQAAGFDDVSTSGGFIVASGGDDCRVHVATVIGSSVGPVSGSGRGWGHAVRTRHRVSCLGWACAAQAQGCVGGASLILVGQEDGSLSIYDLKSPRLEPAGPWDDERRVHVPVKVVHKHAAPVRAVAVTSSPDGGSVLVASGGDDGVIMVSRLQDAGTESPSPIAAPVRIGGHSDYVRALTWLDAPAVAAAGSQPRLRLLSGGWDGRVLQHDLDPHALLV